jgi:hypothetical protein
MGFLSRLFGGARTEAAAAEAIEHNGFLIYPQPIRQGGQFLTAGTPTAARSTGSCAPTRTPARRTRAG